MGLYTSKLITCVSFGHCIPIFLFNNIVDMILNKFPICIEEIVVLKAKPMYLFMVFDADNCSTVKQNV